MMARFRNRRGVVCRPRRLGIIPIALLIMLATAANLPAITMAQDTPEEGDTSAPTSTPDLLPSISPIVVVPQGTLAPLAPISTSPITPSPITPAPVAPETPAPTPAPTLPPAPAMPTVSPTLRPSPLPSISNAPTYAPSFEPTNYPTSSHQPTDKPSMSVAPSFEPSTSPPTVSPTSRPSYSPVFAPSGMPSTNETMIVKRRCEQYLEVEEAKEFDEVQVGIYQLLMQSYTSKFGYEVGPPQIVTTCEVLEQNLAGRKRKLLRYGKQFVKRLLGKGDSEQLRRNLQLGKNLLVMTFTMEYESRFGYDIEEYPIKFQEYINANLEQVTADMAARFLPVIEAREVIVFRQQPTPAPTMGVGNVPSMGPSVRKGDLPSDAPSGAPTVSSAPSGGPSEMVSPTPEPVNEDIVEDRTSFIIGLVAGLGGAALVVALLIWYMRKKNQRKEEERKADAAARANNSNNNSSRRGSGSQPQARMEEGMQVQSGGMMQPGSDHGSQHNTQQQEQQQQAYDNYPPIEEDNGASSPAGAGTIADSIFSNPSMVSGGGSFSSNPEEYDEGGSSALRLDPLQDEFDNYKNQDLEFMRSGVEESVYGAEGMMSLAMTRALMEDEDNAEVQMGWGGAEDPESIEANGLCETNDWLRKNEHSTLDERNIFFQEILNRMVITVRKGMISPSDGTRAIHCCAAMLGLQLEKDLPNNVLLVHGMRKTSDLSLGRSYLVETFKTFGDIEGAAIAPSNRGFGFVRFISPKSVQRALERFRISEIEVQDVSVMIKSLKSDAPVS